MRVVLRGVIGDGGNLILTLIVALDNVCSFTRALIGFGLSSLIP